jgi:hypothetical protein
MQSQDVVVMRAPSELRFDSPPGKHLLGARYGVLPSDWKPDGATFRAVLRASDGKETALFEAHLDPVGSEADRRLEFLRVPFEAAALSTMILRTEPGSGAAPSFETVWAEVEIR